MKSLERVLTLFALGVVSGFGFVVFGFLARAITYLFCIGYGCNT